ncbi:MAG: D-alanyl-D-alanine carboxypeptidase family protein [Lachnospiraceae bacterium]|nr:D-alanyl-D-alanine carboxypeptidase family protein [Lachnospiraceae bacterium]MBQ9465320.1 D-alanyl-D-alanine carboxypeptidase family protein [Lachnospiraceae bacterium]
MTTYELDNEKVFRGDLLLVNASHPLRAACDRDLRPAFPRWPKMLLRRPAALAVRQTLERIGAGDLIVPVSAYRAPSEQKSLYAAALRKHGEDYTRKYVALPGCSEHESGLAVDLALNVKRIDPICPGFPYDGICGEFRKEAVKNGLIERYPAGKEGVTGIAHEPWHFRYVGWPHAGFITENGLAFEDYIGLLHSDTEPGKPLVTKDRKSGIVNEVFHVPADGGKVTRLTLPDNAVYQFSGDNDEGFIVTLWRREA